MHIQTHAYIRAHRQTQTHMISRIERVYAQVHEGFYNDYLSVQSDVLGYVADLMSRFAPRNYSYCMMLIACSSLLV